MGRYILQRLLVIPLILLIANFGGFAYSYIAKNVQLSQNPYGTSVESYPALLPLYQEYIQKALRLDFGTLPIGVSDSILTITAQAAIASVGLLGVAFLLSAMLGILMGMLAVNRETHHVSRWLTTLASIGLAVPGFYLGAIFIIALVWYTLGQGLKAQSPLPTSGMGWDAHLVLPVLALIVRPTVQIARVTAEMMSTELDKQYIVAARAFGLRWRAILYKQAFRNALAPVMLTVASSFRLLVGELILVEWLFSWPGLGSLLAQALIPPTIATVGGLSGAKIIFLYPPLVTMLVTLFALLFLSVDTLVSILVRLVDPRLRIAEAGHDVELAA
jgi:peptide/nickel transport system permease protein